jgi:hypothetical protein
VNVATQGKQTDLEDAKVAPVVLAARKTQEDPGDITAVPLAILVIKRAQIPGIIVAIYPAWPSEGHRWSLGRY